MTMRISFTTNIGRVHYDVPDADVMRRLGELAEIPGPSDIEVTIKETS